MTGTLNGHGNGGAGVALAVSNPEPKDKCASCQVECSLRWYDEKRMTPVLDIEGGREGKLCHECWWYKKNKVEVDGEGAAEMVS